jgi:hypothetical protein
VLVVSRKQKASASPSAQILDHPRRFVESTKEDADASDPLVDKTVQRITVGRVVPRTRVGTGDDQAGSPAAEFRHGRKITFFSMIVPEAVTSPRS